MRCVDCFRHSAGQIILIGNRCVVRIDNLGAVAIGVIFILDRFGVPDNLRGVARRVIGIFGLALIIVHRDNPVERVIGKCGIRLGKQILISVVSIGNDRSVFLLQG